MGCLAIWLLDDREGVRLAVGLAGAPVICTATALSWLLSIGLPWAIPVLTASSIARERELGTFDLLRVTLLTERSIVLGKLAASLARLWPGIVMLALLSPFHLAQGLIGAFLLPSASLSASLPEEMEVLWWTKMTLDGIVGLIRPWADLMLHAAVGLFASVRFRSSIQAIAVAYGALVLVQAFLRLGEMVLSFVFGAVLVRPSLSFLGTLLTMTGATLMFTVIRFGGSILLIWGSVWQMERM